MSVRYRLAPQNPFPAALLDAFTSYLSLIYPPEGAPHGAVPASNIIFSGDSAGGNLALALLQLLLILHRSAGKGQVPKIDFNGKLVDIPLPGGAAVDSPWLDITRSMPSIHANAKYDYLPLPKDMDDVWAYPACDAWPSDPPRVELFCDGSASCHPLISPLAALDWKDSPPVYITCGEEMLADEDKVVAQRMARQGVPVVWEQYEGMPHCFALFLDHLPSAKMTFESWTSFAKDAVEKKSVTTKGTFITAKKFKREDIDVTQLTELKDEDVVRTIKETRDRRIKSFESRTKPEAKL
jgi:acetyl esterase/lipase